MTRIQEKIKVSNARLTGIVYLLYFVTAIIAQSLQRNFFWFAAINMVSLICYLLMTILMYRLLRPVNKNVSLIAAMLSAVGCIDMALYIFKAAAFNIHPFVFFGPYCILLGYLIFRSVFLPRWLGILMMAAGMAWLAYLSPLEKYLSLYIKVLGFIAEAALMLWLIIKGTDMHRRTIHETGKKLNV